MLSKAIKIYINSPVNCEWKTLYDDYNDISYQCSRMLNICMTDLFIHEKRRLEIYDEIGKWPSNKEFKKPYNYPKLRKLFPDVASNTVATLERIANQRWGTDRKQVFYSMDKSLPSFKKTYGVPLHNKQYKLWKENNDYFIQFNIYAGREQRKILKLSEKILGSQKIILDRIIDKKYKQGMGTFKKKGKKLFFVLTYSFEPDIKELNKDNICGIDLGISIPVYCAFNNGKTRWSSNDGTELERFRFKINKRRKAIQKQYPTSTRIGKGRKTALKPLKKLQDKIDNFRNNKYHVYTKRIIDFCIKNNIGMIQLEDLSSLKSNQKNSLIRDWAISDFHSKLEYKAKENGIDIRYIDPKYTSQRCSKCGYIDKENRVNQAHFVCKKCGFKENADYNAAINISTKNIEELIENELKPKEETKKKNILSFFDI